MRVRIVFQKVRLSGGLVYRAWFREGRRRIWLVRLKKDEWLKRLWYMLQIMSKTDGVALWASCCTLWSVVHTHEAGTERDRSVRCVVSLVGCLFMPFAGLFLDILIARFILQPHMACSLLFYFSYISLYLILDFLLNIALYAVVIAFLNYPPSLLPYMCFLCFLIFSVLILCVLFSFGTVRISFLGSVLLFIIR